LSRRRKDATTPRPQGIVTFIRINCLPVPPIVTPHMKFWLLWAFDALVALGFIYFFCIGLLDGSVSSFNIVLWVTILGILAAILGGGYFLHAKKHDILAACLLAVLALPALAYLLFFLVLIVSNPRWN
jgi:hypothetical protein